MCPASRWAVATTFSIRKADQLWFVKCIMIFLSYPSHRHAEYGWMPMR